MYITDGKGLPLHNRDRPGRSIEPAGGEQIVPIRLFVKDAVFGPEAISAMNAAFVDVCNEAAGRSDVSKETIAATIIQLARRGETDPIVLRETALRELDLSRPAKKP